MEEDSGEEGGKGKRKNEEAGKLGVSPDGARKSLAH